MSERKIPGNPKIVYDNGMRIKSDFDKQAELADTAEFKAVDFEEEPETKEFPTLPKEEQS